MSRVLFVCLHNVGRSQMSEALFRFVAGDRHEARSAGSTPAERVHPEVVETMRELGVDVSDRTPHKVDRADAEWADVIVTMRSGDACPYIPGQRHLDWNLPDAGGSRRWPARAGWMRRRSAAGCASLNPESTWSRGGCAGPVAGESRSPRPTRHC